MKGMFDRHNMLSRVIALWLVFIMLTVPLITDSGLLSHPKANGGSSTETFDVQLDDITVTAEDININASSVSIANNHFIRSKNSYKTYHYYSNDPIQVNNIGGTNSIPSDEISETSNTLNFDEASPEVKYKVYENIDNIEADLEDGVSDLSGISISDGDFLVSYIKINGMKLNDVEVVADKYVAWDVYKFVKTNPFKNDSGENLTMGWKTQGNDDVNSATYYGEAKINVSYTGTGAAGYYDSSADPNDVYLGTIKYGYVPCGQSGSTTVWQDAPLLDFTTLNYEGEVEGWIGYFATAASSVALISDYLENHLNVDTLSPRIKDETGLYYKADGWGTDDSYTAGTKITDTKEIRSEDLSKYRYYLIVEDLNLNVYSIKINDTLATFTQVSTENNQTVLYATATTYDSSVTGVKITVSDFWQNESTLENLPVLHSADMTKRDITLKWGSSASNTTSIGSGLNNIITNKKHYFYYRVESYYPLTEIKIVDKNNKTLERVGFDTAGSHAVIPDPYYVYSDIIEVPGGSTNHKYEDVKVHLTFWNGTDEIPDVKPLTASSNYIFYDATNPVFYKSGTADEYAIPDEWNPSADSIKIDIASGEGGEETDITSASYEYTDNGVTYTESFTIENGKVTGGVINVEAIPESTNSDGTLITIKAKDEAENTTTKDYYYKKDTKKPEFNATTPLYFSNDGGTTRLSSGDIIVNKDYTVYADVTDTVSGVDKVKYYCFNGTDTTLLSIGGKEKAAGEGCTLSELIPNGYLDGTYTILVKAIDNAGNISDEKTLSFTLDQTAPTATSKLQVNDSGSWVEVTNCVPETVNGETKNVYYLDSAKSYRYEVTVTDGKKLSGSDALTVVDNGQLGTIDTSAGTGSDTEKTYYINVNNSYLSAESSKEISYTIKDESGNTATGTCNGALQLIDTDLKVEATLYDAATNEKVELTPENILQLKNGTNKNYYVVLEVSWVNEIASDDIKLMYGSSEEIIGVEYNDNNSYVSTPDNRGRYHFYKKFDIPANANIQYTDLTYEVSGEDDNLFTLLVDKTNPIITGSAGGTVFNLSSEWRKSLSADVYITSGDGTVESKLVKALYNVGGVDNNLAIADGDTSVNGRIETASGYSSVSTAGTSVYVYAADAAGNVTRYDYVVKIDGAKPVIETVSVAGNPNITVQTAPCGAAPAITAKVTDNLTIDYIKYFITYPDGTVKEALFDYTEGVDAEVNGGSKEVSYTLENVIDGTYSVEVKAYDLAGNEAASVVKSFKVDSTKPVVSATIGSGTVSNKSAYYYSSDVTINLTYKDENADMSSVKVTDNGEAVLVNWSATPDANGNYTASVKVTAEGAHTIKITGKDRSLNEAVPSQVIFKLDKTNPSISTTLNGGIAYTDNTGMLYLTGNVTLSVGVNDVNEDKEDLNYQLIVTKPDRATESNLYTKTTDRRFNYTEEGEYTINLFAADMANNLSPTRSVKFRIDKAAPSLSINGVGTGTSSDVVNVSCVMQESFWKDAKGTITIYRKAGDGVSETLFDTIDVTPTSASTVISKSFSETGVYRIEFTASDRAGHTSETSATFTVDREAPVVTLDGPDNYAKTTEAVSVAITISDEFYIQKKVTLTGTRTDEEGKVHELDFGSWNAAANPTDISGEFEEDGIYDISVTATDVAGNSTSKSVHFTIDKTAPVIGDLSYLEDKIITSFSWDEDLDELVSDLTVCDIRMYLNGSEYDGTSDIEDGAYTLLITAKDELGNESEKEVKFVLDTKAPVFIVTGVEDNEVKNEDYTISVSLQLEEDTLTKVTLNGKEMSITNNTCTFTVTEKGNYTLVMTASDEAGNTAVYELGFKYGEESKIWIIITATAGTIFASGAGILIFRKKKIK